MAQGGFIVPSAFIVIQDAFWEFRQELGFDFSTQQDLPISDDTIDYIRNLVDNHELKEELVAEINTRLHDLRNQSPIAHPLLAVRSSGVAEDLDNASFAGMNETVLNVECDCSSVCHAVKECWKSLFTRRSIEYRVKNGFPCFRYINCCNCPSNDSFWKWQVLFLLLIHIQVHALIWHWMEYKEL